MKKLFLLTLTYYMLLHIIGPWIYYQIRGEYVLGYTKYLPPEYMDRAAIIILIPVVITFITVLLLPVGKKQVEQSFSARDCFYFLFIALFTIAKQLYIGNYTNHNVINGTLWGYIGWFADMGVLMLIVCLMAQEEANHLILGGLYLLCTLMASSRSGILMVVQVLVAMLVVTRKFQKHRKKILILVLCMCLASPVAYYYSTVSRGSYASKSVGLIDQIVERCSYLELLGIAIYQKENDIWNQEVFERKYSVENQIKVGINSIVPGDIFPDDVYPNQYYRTAFLGVPEQQSKDTYTSINLSLPGYLYMKYPLIISVLLTVVIMVSLFALLNMIRVPQYFLVVLTVMLTGSFLDYFDWVTVMHDIIRYLCTVGAWGIYKTMVLPQIPQIRLMGREYLKVKFGFRRE